MTSRTLEFSADEMERIEACRQALGVSYVEFMHWAVMQSVDQLESTAEAYRRRQRQQAAQDW